MAAVAAVAAVAASCADDSILTLLSLAAKQFHLNEKIGTFCENRFCLIFNLFSFLLRNAAVVEKKIKTCTKEFQEEEEKFASIKQRLWLNLNPQSTQI